jgi:hypothetical protein
MYMLVDVAPLSSLAGMIYDRMQLRKKSCLSHFPCRCVRALQPCPPFDPHHHALTHTDP